MSIVEISATTTAGPFSVTSNFQAGPGITALFGPSGSGKSLTLATIAGLLRPSSGRVSLHGTVVADAQQGIHVPTQQRQIGMVFQQPALLTHRSPLDNVTIGLSQMNRVERREHGTEWLARVQAEHLGQASTRNLSGGERQRIALARALANEPRLLLLDEPFSALDLPTRRSLRQLVRELVNEQGLTAVLVTHDLEDITALADYVVMFEPGRTIGTHNLDASNSAELAQILGIARHG
jgi:molybdate transport system ATP-binding protein